MPPLAPRLLMVCTDVNTVSSDGEEKGSGEVSRRGLLHTHGHTHT